VAIQFKKAVKSQARARIAIIGPSGSGKTYTALRIAQGLAGPDGRIAVIDTERGSASKYADEFEFDVLELETFHPQHYIEAITAAEQTGYEVLIIDSLSHAWAGKEGILELVDQETLRSQSKNAFTEGWRKATPLHNRLVDTMLQSKLHLIVTLRTKTEYVLEKDERTGKTVPNKVGLAPVQRDGLEYEFDIVADMTLDHHFIVTKTRCRALDGAIINKPGAELGDVIKAWLSDGQPVPTIPEKETPTPPPSKSNTALATQKQRKMIFAVAREQNISNDDLKAYIIATYGVTSTTELTTRQASELIDRLKKGDIEIPAPTFDEAEEIPYEQPGDSLSDLGLEGLPEA